MRHLHRADDNQADIIADLRACGFSVLSLTSLGNGCPDLLVARGNRMHLLEVKSDKGEMRESQSDFAKAWNAPVLVVRSSTEALQRLKAMR
jgi:Holliday junction resolvase